MKDLLEQVMPDFEPLPDRLEQVRRKVQARRDRKMAAGAAVAVAVLVAAGAGVVASRQTELEPANTAYQVCEREVNQYVEFFKPRTENVPIGASKVTLCVYEALMESPYHPDGQSRARLWYNLVGARDQQVRDGAIERKVNAMAPPRCSGEYLLVFDYPDKPRFVVQMTDICTRHHIPREELLRDGDLLGWLDRMEQSLVLPPPPGQPIVDK